MHKLHEDKNDPDEYEQNETKGDCLFRGPVFAAKCPAGLAAERYREHLCERYGPNVPEKLIEAFRAIFTVAWHWPDQLEAMITAVRAAVHDRQRYRADSRGTKRQGWRGGRG